MVMNQQGTLPHENSTQIVSQVSLLVIFVLATIISLCICILTLCNHQFTYRADISLISGFFVISCVNAIIFILGGEIPYIIFYSIPILVNVFLTALTLVPLCGRAYGYNICVKTIHTKESHRKALKGILPLLILPLPSYMSFLMLLMPSILYLHGILYLSFKLGLLVSGALGLNCAVAFALHLCFIRKAKLCEQRGRKKTPQAVYGTINELHTTMYVEEKECLRHATST